MHRKVLSKTNLLLLLFKLNHSAKILVFQIKSIHHFKLFIRKQIFQDGTSL